MEVERITYQCLYLGPQLPHIGLSYGAIFKNGVHPHLYEAFDKCPSLRELFVPVAGVGAVRRALNFDFAHNMRGTSGRYVTFYRDVEAWRASQTKQKPKTIETHHA